jgi:hypothetical protein
VRPNPDQQAAELARAAATRPAPTTSVVRPNPDEQNPAPAPTTTVRVTTPKAANGFDWGDAGIGAAAGVALSMIGLGGALAVSQRRTRRSSGSAAVTS